MDDYQPTSRRGLWHGFIVGMAWLAGIAAGVSSISGHSFLTTYLAVVCGTLFTGGLCLAWLARWALNKKARGGQFGVASLFFLITLIAVFLSAVRLLFVSFQALLAKQDLDIAQLPSWVMLPIGLVCLLVVLISVPVVLRLLEAVMWFAVWVVRHPATRRCAKCFRR